MKYFGNIVGLILAMVVSGAPAAAQRELEVEPDVAWIHPHSGIEVPNTLAGLPRGQATEFAPDFLNVGFSFRDGSDPEEISIYIYRDTNGGVPVWFEQARRGIEIRDIYANPQLVSGVEAYAWPGHTGWQGQLAVYDTSQSRNYTSTGVALFSVDGWFVKMRATSAIRSASELRDWMDAAFSELTPPESQFDQEPVMPVEDCAEKLSFKKAKDAKADATAAILNSVLGGIVAKKVIEKREAGPVPAVAWCRDAKLSDMQVAYRANASTNSYLIALGDSGMGVSVAPDRSAAILGEKKKKDSRFNITVITDAQRINYVPQNRLPSLKRVLEVINANRRVSSTSTWGDDDTIELNSDAL